MVIDQDKETIRRLKQGEEQAFMELVQKYKGQAFAISYNLVHSVEDAKEISQDAFVKVYNSLSSFNEDSKFFTWFYRILVNTCLDFKKKRTLPSKAFSQFAVNSENDQMQTVQWVEDPHQEGPLKGMLKDELNERIVSAIEELSKQQKAVFVMRHYEMMPLKEIAAILEMAEGTVKSQSAICFSKTSFFSFSKSPKLYKYIFSSKCSHGFIVFSWLITINMRDFFF